MSAPPPARIRQRAGTRPLLRPATPVRFDERTAYGGLVTRTLAFLLDALLINAVAVIATAVIGIAASVLANDPSVSTSGLLAGAAVFGLWSMTYFVLGWSVGGQTIGTAVMGIRVVDARTGRPLRPCRAIARFIALSLGVIPMLAGLVLLLWDPRRRALHDRIVRSVVVRVDSQADPPAPIRSAV